MDNAGAATSARARFTSVRLSLPEQYAPTQSTNQYHSVSRDVRRAAGHTNVDLWAEGALYPNDPFTNLSPLFQNLISFLQFVGRGENGLLGYCRRLATQNSDRSHALLQLNQSISSYWLQCQQRLAASEEMVGHLRKTVEELQETIKVKDTEILKLTNTITKLKNTPLGTRERKRELYTMQELAPQSGARKRRIIATKYVVEDSRIA